MHFLEDNGNKLNLLKDISERLVSGATLIMLEITDNNFQIKQNVEILRVLLPSSLDEEQINFRFNRIENELKAISEKCLSELLQEAGFYRPTRFF